MNKTERHDSKPATVPRRQFLKTVMAMAAGVSAGLPSGAAQAQSGQRRAGKILIAYFSRTGTTREVAKRIQEVAGGDLFELRTVHRYPVEYRATTEQAKRELNEGFRPQLATRVEAMETYDTVFIGFPNWWGTLPMVFFSFLEHYPLEGKTVIPFCTHEGSRFGRSLDDLRANCGSARILDGLALRGGGVETGIAGIRAKGNRRMAARPWARIRRGGMSVQGRLSRKLTLDGVMLALILAEFAYGLTGSTMHELLGLGLLGLFVLHGGWNWRWFAGLQKGRYRGVRVTTLAINASLLISAALMMASGIVNSDLLFRATGIELNLMPRALHTASAHWFLVLASIHLGLHWTQITAEARRRFPVRQRHSPPWGVLPVITIIAFGLHAVLDRSLYADDRVLLLRRLEFRRLRGRILCPVSGDRRVSRVCRLTTHCVSASRYVREPRAPNRSSKEVDPCSRKSHLNLSPPSVAAPCDGYSWPFWPES